MRAVSLLLLAAATTFAAPDPAREWRDRTRRLAKEEKRFWDEFQSRWVGAWEAFIAPVMEARGRPEGNPNPLYDYTPFRQWYDDFASIQRSLGEADDAFAESGHPKAAETLLKELLDVARRIEKLEAEMLEGRPVKWDTFDQRYPIERHGLAYREQALVQALGRCPGAVAFLSHTAWRQAEKKDGRRSIVRRVAVIDALGATGDESALPVLAPLAQVRESSLRIAALEALLRFGARGGPAARPLLADPSPIVRRALLQTIRERAPDDAAWIPGVLDLYLAASGQLRVEALQTLELLTRQQFGDAPEAWKSWLDEYRKEIDGGGFDKAKVEVREVERTPLASSAIFYGIPTSSTGVIFVIEGSRRIWWPADWEVQKTQYKFDWDRKRSTWDKEHKSHHAVLREQFDQACANLPAGFAFGLVTLAGGFQAEEIGGRRLLGERPGDLKKAQQAIAKLPGDGWCSLYAGLLGAARLAGMGPELSSDFPIPVADTVYLFNNGDPAGGRYMSPEALVEAFRRFNRFRRLTVHTIRICNAGDPSEIVMKGIAEASGGTYVWASKPPGAEG